ncbi:Two-component response regulator, FixJ family, consists of REC and HTH domains [Loktanella sp. DSM 29012]|uniref:response regulator transcription factor n=1 Tax=Loktanella sp. DSM 29012 TaxID=1881056 RepID=UPI0008BC9A8A|nr:response regulator [Loktanella sp. DSM 29012]SEQ84507.1 Two-component response regulator, FixJ family, consists of REC and HTH domains [Loktanella sp. DSM 29012]
MNLPVYLVDDDDAVREGLSLLLRTVGLDVRSFGAPGSFLVALEKLDPGCLILDIRMPQISGLKLQEQLTERGVDWPTIIISGHGDIEACRLAFRNGAIDFLSKPVDEQDLIDAIQKGHAELDSRCQQVSETNEARQILTQLTEREAEVLEMVAKGLTTRQIADALSLSPRTVDSHRSAIGAKAGTTSAAELTRLWLDAGAGP